MKSYKFYIKLCTSKDVKDIFNIQNIVIENFKDEEKGYFLPFKEESYMKIVNYPINDSKIYGAFFENRAKGKGITHIIAEVIFGNKHSLNNLKELGYEIKTWYQKDENIKKYILLKRLEDKYYKMLQ